MEEHPIYGFARHYNPKLTDAEIQAKFIDNGAYMKTLDMLRKEAYPDLDMDTFVQKFHSQYEDLSKKKEPSVSPSYSWDSGKPSLNYSWSSGKPNIAGSGPQTSLTSPGSGKADLSASKRAEQEIALQKAKERKDYTKPASLDTYENIQASSSILAPEKEYEARLDKLRNDSDNMQRAIEAANARIKEKWGENWMEDYHARQQVLNDPNAKNKEEAARLQKEFESDQFVNDRNNFITALEANQKEGVNILSNDKYAYARALEKYDAEKAKKAETSGWGNLTLGILQRSAGKFVGQLGYIMNIGENLVTKDKTYDGWDMVEDFFIDFQKQTDKVAPRPTKYTRPLFTKTAKTEYQGQQVEVDFDLNNKPISVRDKKGMILDVDPSQFSDLKGKNQYNIKGLFYQTGEVLTDAIAQIATTKGIGGTLVKTGMGARAAYALGVTASTAGQMAGQLYDKGLEMFDGDKRKAAQYAAMTGLAIGAGANLFGMEARLAAGRHLNMNITQAARGLTPRAAAAMTAKHWVKEGLGEAFEETILEKAIEGVTAMTLNGDPDDIDLNEMKGTALISFATGVLMAGGSKEFKKSAWMVAAENPDQFKAELEKLKADGQNIDVEKMYDKALKIRALSNVTEVSEDNLDKLDELEETRDKAEKAKEIGLKETSKKLEEEAAEKEAEVIKPSEEEVSDAEVEEEMKQTLPGVELTDEIIGREVEYNGYSGELKKEGDRFVIENDRQIIELEPDARVELKPIEKVKHQVTAISETSATINGVDYNLVTDDNGSVVGLSPINNPDQVIRNEKMLIAAEIERNKMEFNSLRATTDEEYQSIRDSHEDGNAIEMALASGMDDTIANAIDALYDGKPVDEDSAIALDYWIDDRIKALEQMDTPSAKKAISNLKTIKELNYESGSKDTRAKLPKKRVKKQQNLEQPVEQNTQEQQSEQTLEQQAEQPDQATTQGNEQTSEQPMTDLKKLQSEQKKIEEKLGKKKAKKYNNQVSKLFNPNEHEIIELRENGVVTKEGDKYTFHALADQDLKTWRVSHEVDVTDQFDGTREKRMRELLPVIDEVNSFANQDGFIGKNVWGMLAKLSAVKWLRKAWKYTFFGRGDLPVTVADLNYRRMARIQGMMKKAEFTANKLKKLIKGKSEQQIQDLNEALQSTVDTYSDGRKIEPEIMDLLMEMREHVDEMSNELINTGIADGKLAAIISKNLDTYLTRSYQIHFDKNWVSKVKDTAAYTRAKAFLEKKFAQEEADAQAKIAKYQAKLSNNPEYWGKRIKNQQKRIGRDVEAELDAILEKQAKGLSLGDVAKSGSLGSMNLGVFKKRKSIPQEIRDVFGEVKDPIVNYMTSIFKVAHILENNKFLSKVEDEGKDKFLFERPTGPYTSQFPDTPQMGPLAGYYSTPEIVEAFRLYNKPIGDMTDDSNPIEAVYKGMLSITSRAKSFMTIFSIASASRNFTSNLLLQVQKGLFNITNLSNGKAFDPNIQKAFDIFRGDNEAELVELYSLGVLGDGVTFGEIADIRRQYSKRFEGVTTQGKVAEKWDMMTKFMSHIYQFGDEFYRTIDYYRNLDKMARLYKGQEYDTLSPDDQQEVKQMSADRVSSENPTYSRLPRNIKALRRNPFVAPFPSFPYEMVRVSYNIMANLVKDMKEGQDTKVNVAGVEMSYKNLMLGKVMAGTMAVSIAPFLLKELIANMLGWSDDDDEKLKYFVPFYHEGSLLIPSPWNEKNGSVDYYDWGFMFPQGHILSTLSTVSDERFSPAENMGRAAEKFFEPFYSPDPLMKSLVEATYGQQLGKTGRPISQIGETGWLKARMDHVGKKLTPGTIKSFERVFRSFNEPETDYYGKLTPIQELVAIFPGFRSYNVDIHRSFGFIGRGMAEKINDSKADYGVERNKEQVKALPEKERKDHLEKVKQRELKDYEKFVMDFHEIYKAAVTFPGVDPKRIDEALGDLGLDAVTREGVKTGKVKIPQYFKK